MINIPNLLEELILKLDKDVRKSCIIFNASVTSWGRTPARNKKVGGSGTSWHLDWLARDIVFDDPKDYTEYKVYMKAKGYRIIPSNDGAYHVQYDWPVIEDFVRQDMWTHLGIMNDRFPELFREKLKDKEIKYV